MRLLFHTLLNFAAGYAVLCNKAAGLLFFWVELVDN